MKLWLLFLNRDMVEFIQYLLKKFTSCLLFLSQDFSIHLIYLSKPDADVVTQPEQRIPLALIILGRKSTRYIILSVPPRIPRSSTLWLNTLILSFLHSFIASAWFPHSRLPTPDLSTPTALPTMKGGRRVRRNGERGSSAGEGERCAKAWGRNGGRRDWFIGGEERDQGRTSGWDRWLNGAESVWERERRRDEGQGCNWWETWPTPPSLHWSGSMPLSTPASPPSIHSCLHLSLHFSHSV